MLRKIILELDGDIDLVRKEFLGYETYSCFLRTIETSFPTKATKYHQKNVKKPFTLVPPFIIKERVFVTFNLLDEEVSSLFLSALLNEKKITIRKDFLIKKIYLRQDNSLPPTLAKQRFFYEKTHRQKVNAKNIIIKTITPLVFRKNNQYNLNPSEETIKNSFYDHQKEIYRGQVIYFLPEFKILEKKLETRKVDLKPFSTYYGAYGWMKISLESRSADIEALSFFGLGMKTSMGLGQVKIYSDVDDKNPCN
ncbi:MAG: CRISPR-associated endoribonuclease Cas6 [Patescibacteria group bacterium]|nr:CRISPR-associated endoribonuclease Cas6 [Patescibacteria group bacterium]